MDRPHHARRILAEVGMWLLAGLGVVVMGLVAAAYLFNVSLMMFRTGSMEPTIPVGAVAVVREIPADQVEVGQILTVQRPDHLPVTHRVTAVEPGPAPAQRTIRMQGDANTTEDAMPYVIATGGEVLFWVPGGAQILSALGTPYARMGITLAAAGFVGWAFWPRRAEPAPGPPVRAAPRHAASSSRQDR